MNEVAKEFELCEFGLVSTVKGFDPKGIFVGHLKLIKYFNLDGIFPP